MVGLKVLHCIHSLYGGGAETQLRIVVEESDKYDFSSAVTCFDDADGMYLPESVKFVSPHSFKNVIKSYKFYVDTIKDYDPDIVHVWLPAPVTVPAMLAAKKMNKKIVFSYRNRMFFYSFKIYIEFIFALIFSNRIVSNNPISQSSFLFRCLANIKRAVEIPNAISVAIDGQWCASHNADGLKFFYAGRLTEQKNVSYLLDALSNLNARNWSLTVCGQGEDETALKKQCSDLGLDHKITFLGYREDVHKLMLQHDLLIIPSKFEGMPNIVAEAMKVGLPCLLSDIPAHRWIVSDYKIPLFSLSDNQSLVRVIEEVFCGKIDLNEISKAELLRANDFSVAKLMSSYEKFYSDVLGARS